LTWPRSPTSQSFLASPGSSPDRDTDEAADGEGIRVERDDAQVPVLAKKRLLVNKEKRGNVTA
jgi:hypothetical protein